MPLQKNQVLTLQVERLSSDGSGVAHSPVSYTHLTLPTRMPV